MRFKQWISRHLSTLIVVPSLLLFVIVLIYLVTLAGNANQSSKGATLLYLADNASALVHELQKERGMSAGFLGSKGAKFKNEIGKQRALVDNRFANYQIFFEVRDMLIDPNM